MPHPRLYQNFPMTKICPVFIPFAGCLNKCIFCNQNSVTGITTSEITDSAQKQIEESVKSGLNSDKVGFFGGSFSCLDKSVRKKLYNLSHNYGFSRIRVSTRPDCIDNNIVEEMLENGVTEVELGIQTLNDKTLRLNGRPYNREQALNSVLMLKNFFYLVVQLMPGMFGDNKENFMESFQIIADLKPDALRVYPAVIFKNTVLARKYTEGQYIPLTLGEAVQMSLFIHLKCLKSGIEILRTGIPTENLDYSDILGGPFHPAFGDLVNSLAMMLYLKKYGGIDVDNSEKSKVSGYKGVVSEFFGDKMKFSDFNRGFSINSIKTELGDFFAESDFRFFERETAHFAQIIQNKAHHG